MGKHSIRFRNVCVTWNNYPDTIDWEPLKKVSKYFIMAKEVGESGTPHLQGYIEFTSQKPLSAIKKLLHKSVHIEKRKGTAAQASDYCKKEDTDPLIYGKMSCQGIRQDLVNLMTDIKKKIPEKELMETHTTMWRFKRAADRYKYLCDIQDKTYQKMKVSIVIGQAGIGKTSWALKQDPDLYFLTREGSQLWWDGYSDQQTVLIDDFYGDDIKYSHLLRLLDGYRFNLPTKGGFVWKKYTHVIITSNNPPETWYKQGLTPALARRISVRVVLPDTSEALSSEALFKK